MTTYYNVISDICTTFPLMLEYSYSLDQERPMLVRNIYLCGAIG